MVTPLRPLGDAAKDIAPVVTFLLSKDALDVTSRTIHVDGGNAGCR